MKKLLFFLLGLALVMALDLKIQTKIDLDNPYKLHCIDAHGRVVYFATNLPEGVRLAGDTIEIYDINKVKGDLHTIKIKAVDESGQVDEKIVILVIKRV